MGRADKAYGPARFALGERQGEHIRVLYGGGGGHQGPGDAGSGGGHPGGEVVHILDIAKPQSTLGQVVHQVIIKRGGLVPAQDSQRFVHQIRQFAHAGVAGRQHGDKVRPYHRQTVPPLRGGQAAKTEVQLALAQSQQLVVSGEIVELYGHLGTLGAKTGDGSGHQDLGGNAETDAQGAAVARQHVTGGAAELLAGRHQGAGILVKGPPQHGEAGTAGIALKQLAAQLLLQPPYLLAQGRLGDVLAHRCLTEVQHFSQGNEGFQIP
ncbi:hypothetical protein LMBIIBHN_02110 [Aeromonas salmonicida]